MFSTLTNITKWYFDLSEAHVGLVYIVFTSLFLYMAIVTLTFDLQNQIVSILSLRLSMPNLMKKHTMVKSLSCLQAYFHLLC